MIHQFKTLLVSLLVLQAFIGFASANTYVSGVSWVFRGTAQQNNSVLTFNMYDTLNLVCRASGVYRPRFYFTFAITKGSSAPTNMAIEYVSDYYSLTVSNAGTMVWNDFDGIQPGFENFVIFSDGLPYGGYADQAQYAFRYMNVGTLMSSDAGTYHCSVADYMGNDPDYLGTSGGLTIVVNTKEGQAHSSPVRVSHSLAYSAVIIGASKLIF